MTDYSGIETHWTKCRIRNLVTFLYVALTLAPMYCGNVEVVALT